MECGRGLEAAINLPKMIDYGAESANSYYFRRNACILLHFCHTR